VSQERLPKCPLCFSALGQWSDGTLHRVTLVFGSAGTMRVSGFSKKLFLIAWAALGAIATIGWFYFIAILFRFIINLL
jgi:hypothetical protein